MNVVIKLSMRTRTTSTDGHKNEDDEKLLQAEIAKLREENLELRLYTQWILESLKVLPPTVTDWVAGIVRMSPLRRSDEPPVDPQ